MLILQFWAISCWASPKMMHSQQPMAEGELQPTLFCARCSEICWTCLWGELFVLYITYITHARYFLLWKVSMGPFVNQACQSSRRASTTAIPSGTTLLEASHGWQSSCSWQLWFLAPTTSTLSLSAPQKIGKMGRRIAREGLVFGNNSLLWFQFGMSEHLQ